MRPGSQSNTSFKMASSSKKKVDLRDLMKKQRAESTSTSQRINSPLAKYNSLGQLVCVVCNCQVKNEIVWPAHLQGKRHKENVVALRHQNTPNSQPHRQISAQSVSHSTVKRKAEDSITVAAPDKMTRTSDHQDGSTKGLPPEFFISEMKGSPSLQAAKKLTGDQSEGTTVSSLPSDFFDSSTSFKSTNRAPEEKDADVSNSTDSKSKERKPSTAAEAIPEGFFDDPVMDAKVRNVEVKNTMEEEWNKFQKEMAEENQVSENIQVEDEEAAQVDRNIDEIDEQIHCFAKVEALRDKQDDIKSQMEAKKLQQQITSDGNQEEDIGSGDEVEFEEFLDWRSKGVWK